MHRYQRRLIALGIICGVLSSSLALAESHSMEGINNITVPFFGVPLTVLAMAATGALIGAGYTPPVESRRKLYTLTLANTLFAAWFVVLIPAWKGWEITPIALPPLAGVVAAANCVLVPMMFKGLPGWVGAFLDRLFNRPNPPPPPTP